jgi:streptomycin 6-kinase
MYPLPPTFVHTIRQCFGAAGTAWLHQLPVLVDELCQRWALALGPTFPLSYHYVAAVTRVDGSPAVLKLGVPHPELNCAIAALHHDAGRGCARLLAADAAAGAQLIEWLNPGTPLAALVASDDRRATQVAAAVMVRCWHAPPPEHHFPSVADWLAGLGRLRTYVGGTSGPLPAHLVAEAETLAAELLASQATPVLLHGDLHHGNILAAMRQPWLAIDPKGVIGEPAYEVGALLRNPLPDLLRLPHPERIMADRIAILSEHLELDRVRLRNWGLVQAVLSAWWSIEDGADDWAGALACAQLLADLPG